MLGETPAAAFDVGQPDSWRALLENEGISLKGRRPKVGTTGRGGPFPSPVKRDRGRGIETFGASPLILP